MSEKKRRPRTRLSRGVFVSMCLVAAFVLAVGTGIFAHYTQNSSSRTTEHPSATNLDDSVAEVSTVKKDQVKPLEIENDPDLGNYEKDTVLVLVDNEQERDRVSNLLAESEFLRAQDVTNQDISAGFVRVEIESGTSMKQAIESFAKQGLQAQPNHVYYPLRKPFLEPQERFQAMSSLFQVKTLWRLPVRHLLPRARRGRPGCICLRRFSSPERS